MSNILFSEKDKTFIKIIIEQFDQTGLFTSKNAYNDILVSYKNGNIPFIKVGRVSGNKREIEVALSVIEGMTCVGNDNHYSKGEKAIFSVSYNGPKEEKFGNSNDISVKQTIQIAIKKLQKIDINTDINITVEKGSKYTFGNDKIIYDSISYEEAIKSILDLCNNVYQRREKANLDNHANQMNPNNDEYWYVRKN